MPLCGFWLELWMHTLLWMDTQFSMHTKFRGIRFPVHFLPIFIEITKLNSRQGAQGEAPLEPRTAPFERPFWLASSASHP